MNGTMQSLFVTRNVDRAGVAMGVAFAAIGAFTVLVVEGGDVAPKRVWPIVAILGLLGFGVSRTLTYGIALEAPAEERVGRRLAAIYQGLWFGGFMALTQAGDPDLLAGLILFILGGGFFGATHFWVLRRALPGSQPGHAAVDLTRPAVLTGEAGKQLRWQPWILLMLVLSMGLNSRDVLLPGLVLAVGLSMVRPVYRPRETGSWFWIGVGWIVLCGGVGLWLSGSVWAAEIWGR